MCDCPNRMAEYSNWSNRNGRNRTGGSDMHTVELELEPPRPLAGVRPLRDSGAGPGDRLLADSQMEVARPARPAARLRPLSLPYGAARAQWRSAICLALALVLPPSVSLQTARLRMRSAVHLCVRTMYYYRLRHTGRHSRTTSPPPPPTQARIELPARPPRPEAAAATGSSERRLAGAHRSTVCGRRGASSLQCYSREFDGSKLPPLCLGRRCRTPYVRRLTLNGTLSSFVGGSAV